MKVWSQAVWGRVWGKVGRKPFLHWYKKVYILSQSNRCHLQTFLSSCRSPLEPDFVQNSAQKRAGMVQYPITRERVLWQAMLLKTQVAGKMQKEMDGHSSGYFSKRTRAMSTLGGVWPLLNSSAWALPHWSASPYGKARPSMATKTGFHSQYQKKGVTLGCINELYC